jgi:hypothetical protein
MLAEEAVVTAHFFNLPTTTFIELFPRTPCLIWKTRKDCKKTKLNQINMHFQQLDNSFVLCVVVLWAVFKFIFWSWMFSSSFLLTLFSLQIQLLSYPSTAFGHSNRKKRYLTSRHNFVTGILWRFLIFDRLLYNFYP